MWIIFGKPSCTVLRTIAAPAILRFKYNETDVKSRNVQNRVYVLALKLQHVQ